MDRGRINHDAGQPLVESDLEPMAVKSDRHRGEDVTTSPPISGPRKAKIRKRFIALRRSLAASRKLQR